MILIKAALKHQPQLTMSYCDVLNTRIRGKNKIASAAQFKVSGGDYVYWTKSTIKRGTISELQGVWYTMTCDKMSKKVRKEMVNKLVKQNLLLIGSKEPHPWLKLAPVFKLWFMEREFFGSILERQRDTSSVMITEFHQSLVAENYKFLHGIYACELIQHNVEENHHPTWTKEGSWG